MLAKILFDLTFLSENRSDYLRRHQQRDWTRDRLEVRPVLHSFVKSQSVSVDFQIRDDRYHKEVKEVLMNGSIVVGIKPMSSLFSHASEDWS